MGCVKSKCFTKKNKKTPTTPIPNIKKKFALHKNMSETIVNEVLGCDDLKKHKWCFENLVIEGAGSNGIVTVGACRVLNDINILNKIKRFAGSSSGSIFATLLAIKMPVAKIEQIVFGLNVSSFKDDSFGMIRDMRRLVDEYGFYKGDELESFIETQLEEETGINHITFQQVKDKYGSELYITRTNLSKLCTEYLSPDTTPDMPVSKAVRQSTSIPFIFKAPVSDNGDIITDGAIGAPYPINLFDRNSKYNKKTIGLKIMSPALEQRDQLIRSCLGFDISDMTKFIEALITYQTVTIERLSMSDGYWERTISLSSPNRNISDFDISYDEKNNEIHQGSIDTILALVKHMGYGHF